jgi:lysophospholipase L1-like esterase
VIGHPEYVSDDGVHFNTQGQDVLGHQVAQAVLTQAAG